MSRPVNFYETAPSTTGMATFSTGTFGSLILIVPVSSGTAWVGPYAQVFSGSGMFFPPGLLQTFNANFWIQYFEDTEFYPQSLNINFQGTLKSGNKDFNYLNFGYSGNLWPNSRDTGNFSINFTGNVASGNKDIYSVSYTFTGNVLSNNVDIFSYYSNFSGADVISGQKDKTFINYSISSGDMFSGSKDIPILSFNFYGGLYSKNNDNANVNFILSGISYSVGYGFNVWNTSLIDSENINMVFSGIDYHD